MPGFLKKLIYISCLLISVAKADNQSVIINEIHYDPDIRTELVEFIELYNSGTSVVDLSG